MKKNSFAKLLLCFIMIFAFSGCGDKREVVSNNSEQSDKNADFKEEIIVEDATDLVEEALKNEGKRVVCLGDSMTEGSGGNGMTMPLSLSEAAGVEVLNYGVFGETTSCIAARSGANKQYSNDTVTVPSDKTPVKVMFKGKYGFEMLLVFGDAGINPCFFGGIKGRYYIDDEGTRFFEREEEGEETELLEGTPLETFISQDKRKSDILVIWTGNNEQPETDEEIALTIAQQKEIIEDYGSDKYIVLSLTSYDMLPAIDKINEAFSKEYGEHYCDVRKYFLTDALKDAGITPTNEDLEDIKKGDVPKSLRSDEVHGTEVFYRLCGVKVYEKLKEMGYLE